MTIILKYSFLLILLTVQLHLSSVQGNGTSSLENGVLSTKKTISIWELTTTTPIKVETGMLQESKSDVDKVKRKIPIPNSENNNKDRAGGGMRGQGQNQGQSQDSMFGKMWKSISGRDSVNDFLQVNQMVNQGKEAEKAENTALMSTLWNKAHIFKNEHIMNKPSKKYG